MAIALFFVDFSTKQLFILIKHIIASCFCVFFIDDEIILPSGEKNQILIWARRFEICFRLFNIEGLELTIKPKIQAYDLFYLKLSFSQSASEDALKPIGFSLAGHFDHGKSR